MSATVNASDPPDVWGWSALLAGLSVPQAQALRQLMFGAGNDEVIRSSLRSASVICTRVLWLEMPEDEALSALQSCMEQSMAFLESGVPGSVSRLTRLLCDVTDHVEGFFFWSLVCVRLEAGSHAPGRSELLALLSAELVRDIEIVLSAAGDITSQLRHADLTALREDELLDLFEGDEERLRDWLDEYCNVAVLETVLLRIRDRLSPVEQRALVDVASNIVGQPGDEAMRLLHREP